MFGAILASLAYLLQIYALAQIGNEIPTEPTGGLFYSPWSVYKSSLFIYKYTWEIVDIIQSVDFQPEVPLSLIVQK